MLLHPTSLPGGRLGPDAYAFVDWLAAAGQSWWQMLPLGPPDEHRSPYKARSAFAAWEGLLAEPDAPVSEAEVDAFREAHAFWAPGWEAFGGSLADQVRFQREWDALRAYAAERGVRLIGDIPIYVAEGGADHAGWPELFQTGVVAGAPPDRLGPEGQHWGNPIYDWPAMRRRRYRWWVERVRRVLELFDVARIDHFRGFVAYWAIPADDQRAVNGHWARGPGAAPFRAMAAELGDLALIAEDLGVITEPVRRLRRSLNLPGMVVTQFAFEGPPTSPHRLANHDPDAVVYTGTHDMSPIAAWWAAAPERVRGRARAAFEEAGVADDDPVWAMIGLTMSSRANLAIVQAQDVLGLGEDARMNVPGVEGGANWRWRLEPGQLTDELAARLRAAAERAGRLPAR